MGVFCFICEKLYSTQSSLNRHRREVHNLQSSVVSYGTESTYKSFICQEKHCDSSFVNSEALRNHLFELHNIEKRALHEMEFSSMEEFETWFNQEQRDTIVNYYLKTTTTNGDLKTLYFYCNRTGKILPQQGAKKRSSKSQGSCKINKFCTSQIIVNQDIGTNKCSVRYFNEHYAHEIEVQHVRIHKLDRQSIASKLISGLSVSNILDTSRNKIGVEDKLNRVDLLVRKDVNNIKTAYNININDGCRHKDDATSVQLFVTECSKSDLNPVVFYKPQGHICHDYNLEEKDFCIILITESQLSILNMFANNIISIDSTHGLNAYNFEMTTVIVIDEYGEGFPATCMYTNRKDTYIYEVFFSQIKEKAGEIKAKTFMSDIAPAFYNAWCKIMGNVEHQLLCAWHVDRCWRTNLIKISNKDQRQVVYKTLKHIQYLLDENDFEIQLEAFLLYLNDPSLLDFKIYLLNNYINIKTQWAYAYRKQCNINTNMHLESMHRALKYFYFDGKKIKRLDKSISMLLKFIKDKTIERLIKITKGKTTHILTKIHARHRAAISATEYKLESDSFGEGIVKNVTTNETFTVRIQPEVECCQIKCCFCHICIHSCSCSCIDFAIRTTLCKHIHFYIINSKSTIQSCQPTESVEENVIDNTKTLLKAIDNKKLSDLKEEVESTALKIAAKIKTDAYSYEQINMISKHLKIVNSIDLLPEEIEIPSKRLKPDKETITEPPNKNINKQLSFFSTKNKNKKKEQTLKKPNQDERLAIKGYLNDHIY